MTSTYSTSLGIELMGTGDQSGTWGTTTNTNLGTLIEQAIAGYATQAVTDSSSATVLTIANGASSTGRNAVISLTGTLTAARVVEVPAKTKTYIFANNTTGGFAVTVKVTGQTGVSIAAGNKALVYCDGTDVRLVVSDAIGSSVVTLTGTQTLTNKTLTAPVIDAINNTPIGGTTAAAGAFTSLSYSTTLTGGTGVVNLGSGQFYKDSSGNVGIGTSSPGQRLDLGGGNLTLSNSTGTQQFYLYRASATNYSSIGTDSGAGGVTFTTGTSTPSERMRIDSSGLVGVGTASPTAGNQMEIKAATGIGASLLLTSTDATANAQAIVKGSRQYQIGTGNASSGFAGVFYIYDATAGATRYLVGASGELGVGGANYGTSGQVLTSGGSGAAPSWTTVSSSGSAKAWVRWAGSTGTIASSFNVSSVTRNSTGNYTVNFTSALANANYAPIGMTAGAAAYNSYGVYMQQTSAPTTTSCALTTLSNSGTAVDCISAQVAMFGT